MSWEKTINYKYLKTKRRGKYMYLRKGGVIEGFRALHNEECNVYRFHSFIYQWLYSPLLGPGLFFSFVMFFTQSVGLLERGISPSQGHYLHTGKHKHRINAHTHP
jgi:hypothetical protein